MTHLHLLGAAGVLTAAGFLLSQSGEKQEPGAQTDVAAELKAVKERLTKVESRLEAVESRLPDPESKPAKGVKPEAGGREVDRPLALVKVEMTKKYYQDSNARNRVYQDSVWMNFTLTPSGLKKPARAVKGTMEFMDLFGEVKFRLGMTVTEGLTPGKSLDLEGRGFDYNQFMDTHRWMRTTEVKDMKVQFRVKAVIYEDGTTETLE